MICVNLYGGPGVGKSTMAADIFSALKCDGIKAELVGEFAKELSYDMAYNVMADQHYLFAVQAHRLWRLEQAGVEVAVCDSPLLLNLAYDRQPNNGYFIQYVISTYKQYQNLDFVLKRDERYWDMDQRKGNIQDAIQMDHKIDAILLDVLRGEYPKIKIDPNEEVDFSFVLDEIQSHVKMARFRTDAAPKRQYQDEPWRAL